MFYKKEIEYYQSITAPEALKQRVVMTSKKPTKRPCDFFTQKSTAQTGGAFENS